MLSGEIFDEAVLRMVGVLILVDQDKLESPAEALEHFGKALE